MDESQMHIAKSKKTVEKGDILHDFHYITFCKRESSRDGKQINCFQLLWEGGEDSVGESKRNYLEERNCSI